MTFFWDSIETAGDCDKSSNFTLKGKIILTTLKDVANNDLIHYVNKVK